MRLQSLADSPRRPVVFGASLVAALVLAACASAPQQVLKQTAIDSQHAIVVIGVSQKDLPPGGRLEIVLNGYSAAGKQTSFSPFYYESTNGPPQSAIAKYYVYRVPAGLYTVLLGPLPVVKSFEAPMGRAVYLGDFAIANNTSGFELRDNLPVAQATVASLLPNGLPLVRAD
jgi:hypothetical protein